MKFSGCINVHYPTVEYGNVEVNLEVEVDERDLSAEDQSLPLAPRSDRMGAIIRYLLQTEWLKMRDEVERNLSHKFSSILSPQVEMDLIKNGRIKRK